MNLKSILLLAELMFFATIGEEKSDVSSYERSIRFSGYEWEVRDNDVLEGPGPNYFSDSPSNVWVDPLGRLHMKITYQDGQWYGAEVINKQTLGYGKYTFHIESQLEDLDPNVVFGLFTYDTESPDAQTKSYREIDIEFAEWGNESYPNAQYTIWHSETDRESHTFDSPISDGNWSTHSFNWLPKGVSFESFGGHYEQAPNKDFIWQQWNFENDVVPDEGLAKIHMNLWLFEGDAPKDNQEVEVVISKFTFEAYQ